MSQLPPAQKSAPGADPSAAEPDTEVAFHEFWQRNRNVIFGLFAVLLLAAVVREGWQYYNTSREADVRAEFAKLADQPARLGAFADAHAGHPLAGVALLKVADDRFTAGDFAAAATDYAKAAGSLQNDALLGRAKVGAAVSQLSAGDKAAGQAALQAILADATLAAGARAEAGYDLASLATEAGKPDDVRKLAEQVSRIDPTSPWSQRATMLVASLPATATLAPSATEAPANGLSFKPAAPTPEKPPGK